MIEDDENVDVDDEFQDEGVDNEFQQDVIGDEFQEDDIDVGEFQDKVEFSFI